MRPALAARRDGHSLAARADRGRPRSSPDRRCPVSSVPRRGGHHGALASLGIAPGGAPLPRDGVGIPRSVLLPAASTLRLASRARPAPRSPPRVGAKHGARDQRVSGPLDRQGPCPQCGATIDFPFAAAGARICPYCRHAVVRTDRAWIATGRVADLLPLPSPLPVGATATLGNWRLRIAGRVQYDREGAASAPWQELFVEYATGAPGWLALAQGRCYATWQAGPAPLPAFQQAAPGTMVPIPGMGNWIVAERGARRLLSAEGELPFPIRPNAIEWYADLSGPAGAFGTIDYGDGSRPPVLFTGRIADPSELRLDVAVATEPAPLPTKALTCHGCGASLPLVAPGSTQRIVCQYCGGESDLVAGAATPAGEAPLPSTKPQIPLGAAGHLRGQDVICVGFMVRGTVIDGEHYEWREYLLFLPQTRSYVFLLEDEDNFEYIVPISAGEVETSPDRRA